jgi:hypothetical protein
MGWTGSAIKELRVLNMQLDESGEVKLTLQEYTNVYTWQEGPEEDDSPTTTIPNPFVVGKPRSLSLTAGSSVAADGSAIPSLSISFLAAIDAFVVEYIITISPVGFNPSEVRLTTANLTAAQKAGTAAINYLVQPALVTDYTVDVRSVNDAGVRSGAETATVSVTGDTTAPSAPVWDSPALFGGVQSIGLYWTNPSNNDFAYVKIQRSLDNSSWVTVSDQYGRPSANASFVDVGLANSSLYYYRIFAYDWSNNASSSAGTQSATTQAAPLNTSSLEPRAVDGYLYLQAPTASSTASVSTPSASGYNWATGLFTTITSGWEQTPPQTNPVGTAGAGLKYWAARYYVAETTYDDGTDTAVVSTPFSSFLFNGLVTFSNLNTELANSASSLVTTIDGGLIKTGVVDLANAGGMAVRQGKTGYASNTNGFWLGNNGSTASPDPRFNIGDANDYLKWDGTNLSTSGLQVKNLNGEIILDAGGGGISVGGGSIIRNGAFRDERQTSTFYLTNTANTKIIDGWEVADSSSGTNNTSFWGTQGVFQFLTDHTIRTTNLFPIEHGETLYLAVNNFMPSITAGNERQWSIAVQYFNSAGTFLSQTSIDYDDPAWGDTAPTGGARQISQAVISVPSTSTIRTCRIRIRGGIALDNNAYVNIWNVYLGRSPTQITGDTISTYIKDLAVDTLKIQNNAVTVPLSVQYGSSLFFTNGVETVINSTTLAVNFGANVPAKVIILALSDLGSGGTLGTNFAAAQFRLRYNTTNSTQILNSTVVQAVQENARRGGPPSLNITNTISGWSGTRYFFLTMEVTGENGSATGWWQSQDANISILGAKK